MLRLRKHISVGNIIGIIPKEDTLVIITQITNDPTFLLYLTLVLHVILTYAIILVLSLKVILITSFKDGRKVTTGK